MRTIQIDEDVWAELQKHAQGFDDTPNGALRRILKLSIEGKAEFKVVSRRRGEEITTEQDYNTPILASLVSLGGRARAEEVLQNVWQRMRNQLKPADYLPVPSGEIRWRNAARWARNTMARKTTPPLLNPSSPHGVWEITEQGRNFVRRATPNGNEGAL